MQGALYYYRQHMRGAGLFDGSIDQTALYSRSNELAAGKQLLARMHIADRDSGWQNH